MPGATANEAALARSLVLATVLFTLVLCFAHTNLFPVSNAVTAACELGILGVAAILVARKSAEAILLLFLVTAYVLLLAVLRYSLDAKTVRDIAIPILFYALGRQYGSLRSADRLVNISLFVVLLFAALEWLFLPAYVKLFDIQSFYISRGAIEAGVQGGDGGLFTSGLRFEGRTLFPFLGEHRVSSVFLEPISLGNFAAIAFIWTLYRAEQNLPATILKMLTVFVLLVLGDARFGLYLSAVLLVIFFAGPLVRPVMLLAAPFLIVLVLAFYSFSHPNLTWDNTSMGRLLLGGQLLTSLDLSQVFGAGASGANIVDSGYAYLLAQFGIIGFAALWALFVYDKHASGNDWNFKVAVSCYLLCLLAISASPMTIKTGALLWFLVGVVARQPLRQNERLEESQVRDSRLAMR